MVSPNLLDLIDQVCISHFNCKKSPTKIICIPPNGSLFHRQNKEPFGGMQMIFFGDFLQLKCMGSERFFRDIIMERARAQDSQINQSTSPD